MKFFTIPFITLLFAGCATSGTTPPEVSSVTLREEASEGGITCVFEGRYPLVQTKNPSEAITSINDLLQDKILGEDRRDIEECPRMYAELVEDESTLTETVTVGFEVELNEKGLLSISHMASHYLEDAAHPSNSIGATTVDVSSGKEYSLTSLFQEDAPYRDRLEDAVYIWMESEDLIESSDLLTTFDEWVFFLRPETLILTNLFDVYALQGARVEIPLEELFDVADPTGPLMRFL